MQWTEKRRAGQRAARRNGRYIESLADRTRAYPAARAAARFPAGRKGARPVEQQAVLREKQTEAARIEQKGMQCAGRMEVLLGEPKEAQPAGQREVLCGRRKGAQPAEQTEAAYVKQKAALCAEQKEATYVKQKAALYADRKEVPGGRRKAAPSGRRMEAQDAGQMEARHPGVRVQMEEKDQARRQRSCAGIRSGKCRIPEGRNVPERTGSRTGR